MARREPQPKSLSAEQMRNAFPRLRRRIQELREFDVSKSDTYFDGKRNALENSISDTLEDIFGKEHKYYQASWLYIPALEQENEFNGVDRVKWIVGKGIERSVQILEGIVRDLEEKLEHREADNPLEDKGMPVALSRRVFVVHGHDDGAREAVARFLERLDFEAIILHERASRGCTVIEKVENHGDVGFAVVLLTPDDVGCVKGGEAQPRARQNVLLELGYFIGRLGRDRVCALKRGDLEIPSDFGGVVYDSFDAGGGWKQALGRELQAAGFVIDWNKVMGG